MVKLRTPNVARKLREKTNYRPQLKCATRWTGVYKMITRFFELKPFVDILSETDDSVAACCLNQIEKNDLLKLNEKLTDLSSVMTKLQVPFIAKSNYQQDIHMLVY